MESVDTHAVENFLRLAKGSSSKEEFLSRVREFDQKFVDSYPSPVMAPLPNIPKSNSQQQINTQRQPSEPPKNPFINPNDEQNYPQKQTFTQTQYNQFQTPPQPQYVNRRVNPVVNIPHSRSETNFYRQEPEQYEDVNATYAHNFYQEEPMYNQGKFDRSYSHILEQDPQKNKNYYQSSPYIQNNEFISNYEAEDPNFVKFFKKAIPQQNLKANFTPTSRSNPFKQ